MNKDKLNSLPFVENYNETNGLFVSLRRAVIPSIIGSDIGRGSMAQCTSIKLNDVPAETLANILRRPWDAVSDDIARILISIKKNITFANNRKDFDFISNFTENLEMVGSSDEVKFCVDEDNYVWVVVSGYHCLGHAVGEYFVNLAKKVCDKKSRKLPDENLAYFLAADDSKEYWQYINVSMICLMFAYRLRVAIMNRVIETLGDTSPGLSAHNHSHWIMTIHEDLGMKIEFRKNIIIITDTFNSNSGIILGDEQYYFVRRSGMQVLDAPAYVNDIDEISNFLDVKILKPIGGQKCQ